MRREARRGDAPAAGRAGHVARRRCLQGLTEGVDAGEADGRGGRRRRRGGCGSCGCGGLGVSSAGGGSDSGGARSSSNGGGGVGAAPLQRWRALQVHACGRSRGRAGPPGTVGLDGDVGDELCFCFVFFSKKRLRKKKNRSLGRCVFMSLSAFVSLSLVRSLAHLPKCRCRRPRPARLSSGCCRTELLPLEKSRCRSFFRFHRLFHPPRSMEASSLPTSEKTSSAPTRASRAPPTPRRWRRAGACRGGGGASPTFFPCCVGFHRRPRREEGKSISLLSNRCPRVEKRVMNGKKKSLTSFSSSSSATTVVLLPVSSLFFPLSTIWQHQSS